MENQWIKGKKGAFAPIIAVAVLIIVYGLFQSLFIECGRTIAKCQPFSAGYIFTVDPNPPINQQDNSVNGREDKEKLKTNRKLIAERYSGRVIWVFFVAVSVLLCLATFFSACLLVYKSSSFIREKATARIIILLVLSLLLGSLLFAFPRSYTPVMMDILGATIAQQGQFGIPVVFGTMNFTNSFTYAAAFMLVFASCAILLPREGVPEADGGNAVPNENEPAGGESPRGRQ